MHNGFKKIVIKITEGFSVYEGKFIKLRTKVQKTLKVSKIKNTTKRKFKHPKIEFKLFGKDNEDWLTFSAQFEKIYNDDEMILLSPDVAEA